MMCVIRVTRIPRRPSSVDQRPYLCHRLGVAPFEEDSPRNPHRSRAFGRILRDERNGFRVRAVIRLRHIRAYAA
eukprot:scaffold2262_cov262-Pinguiococcus_pyrenoidosus.AAC.3